MKAPISFLLVFVFFIVHGQETTKTNIAFNAGSTITLPYSLKTEQISQFEGHPETKYLPGIGVFIETLGGLNLNPQLSINTGFNLILNRFEVVDKIGFTTNKGKVSTSYLNMPFMVQWKFKEKFPVTFSAGCYFGICLTAREKGITSIDTTEIRFIDQNDPVLEGLILSDDYSNNIKRNYKSVDFGYTMQVSYRFKWIDKLKTHVFVRNSMGLMNVLTNSARVNYSAETWKNYQLLLGVGISY